MSYKNSSMFTTHHIKQHEVCIEILEGINHFKRMIDSRKESILGFAGTFYDLRIKYTHDIEIYNMCINRLEERYYKIIEEF